MTRRRQLDAGILLAVLVTAAVAVTVRPHGSMVAAWWPAGGLEVWLLLRQDGRRGRIAALLGMALVVGGVNAAVPGRPLWLALCFGVLSALEALICASLLTRHGHSCRLTRVQHFQRLLTASAAGSLVIATAAAPLLQLTAGVPMGRTFVSVLPSHLSGQLLVLALVLLPAAEPALPRWRSWLALAAVAASFAVTFALGAGRSVAFLPLAVLVGSTFVLRPRTIAAAVLGGATVSTFATALGYGPFALDLALGHAAGESAALEQLYVVCLIGLAAPLSLAIREREQALRVERAANDQLVEYARMRTDLLNAVTHELRTPLTTILGYTEVLATGVAGELTPTQREVAEKVHRNGQRLLDLVNDLLDAAAFGTDEVRAPRESVDLLALVEEARQTRPCLASATRITTDRGREPIRVEVDPRRMRRALEQVLANACRVTPAEVPVEIRVQRCPEDPGSALITVTDHGCGISAEEIEHVFEPFFRTRAALAEARAGVGLGLALAKEIVLAHGGTIVLTSEVGRGTSATIRLPLVVAPRSRPFTGPFTGPLAAPLPGTAGAAVIPAATPAVSDAPAVQIA